jgi:hypothetical protein
MLYIALAWQLVPFVYFHPLSHRLPILPCIPGLLFFVNLSSFPLSSLLFYLFVLCSGSVAIVLQDTSGNKKVLRSVGKIAIGNVEGSHHGSNVISAPISQSLYRSQFSSSITRETDFNSVTAEWTKRETDHCSIFI